MTNPILVRFDGRWPWARFDGRGPLFEAVEIVGSWNGWAIPRVTVDVARAIAADLEREKDFGPAAEVRAVIRDEARPDGTVVLNLGLVFSKVEPPESPEETPESPEEKPEARSLPQAAAAGVSNLVRWAMTWAASEIARENAKAQAEQNAKRDAERAALVTEIRKRRAEAGATRAFQLAPGELGWTGMPGKPVQVVPWSELEQVPIGGYGREAEPTEGVVAAYKGRVFVVIQLRRAEGWDPVWCLLSLSGDVCGHTG